MSTVFDITDRRQAKEALQEKVDELEKFREVTISRELRMIELKKEIEQLKSGKGSITK